MQVSRELDDEASEMFMMTLSIKNLHMQDVQKIQNFVISVIEARNPSWRLADKKIIYCSLPDNQRAAKICVKFRDKEVNETEQ